MNSNPVLYYSEQIERYARLKSALVNFASQQYHAKIAEKLGADPADSVLPVDEEDLIRVVDDIIFGSDDESGLTVLERFVLEGPDLDPVERMTISNWRDAVIGVFRLGTCEGLVVEAHNLVDDLDYRIAASVDSRHVRRMLGSGGYLFSRIVPMDGFWVLSGLQNAFTRAQEMMAYGMAAEVAQKSPRMFFRNPRNLEQAREAEREQHRRFREMFGAPWVVGTPEVIEEQWRNFMQAKLDPEIASRISEMCRLSPDIRSNRTVGMIHYAEEGLLFLEEFGCFLDALQDPSRLALGDNALIVLGYLESPGVAPVVFDLAFEECPEQLNRMLAVLFNRPGFDWSTGREACFRKHNPEFLEETRLPGTLPLDHKLVEGLRSLHEWRRRSESGSTMPPAHHSDRWDTEPPPLRPPAPPSRKAKEKAKRKRKAAAKMRKRGRKR